MGPGIFESNGLDLATFAQLLSQKIGETVIDMTGLKGLFVIKLRWTPESSRSTGTIGFHGRSRAARVEAAADERARRTIRYRQRAKAERKLRRLFLASVLVQVCRTVPESKKTGLDRLKPHTRDRKQHALR